MDRRWSFGAFALAVLMGPLAPALAQAQPAEPKAETIAGLPGAVLKLVPPADLCRVDPVAKPDAFQAMTARLSGKVLGVWLYCPDLAGYQKGTDIAPARWMVVIAQRDGLGEVSPHPGLTRPEAFAIWTEAFETEAAQRMAFAEKKLKADNIDAEFSPPRLAGPDGTALYMIIPGRIRDAGVEQPVPVVTVSALSLFFDYRIGVSLSERRAGPDRAEPLRAEAREIMLSLDHLSQRAAGP